MSVRPDDATIRSLTRAASGSTPVDPYLLWAAVTGFAYFRKRGDIDLMLVVPVLAELAKPFGEFSRQEQEHLLALVKNGWPTQHETRYWTGYVERTRIADLIAAQPVLVRRFQLTLPRRAPSVFDGWTTPFESSRPRHTLAVIDDACCVAHPSFLFRPTPGKAKTRIASVWDQDPAASAFPPWQKPYVQAPPGPPSAIGGQELTGGVIDEILDRTGPGPRSERALYVDGLRRSAWGREGRSHGAGVLQLLAGIRDTTSASDVSRSAYAPIVFVQLPTLTVADSSGASLGSCVLDGVRFVVDRARRIAGGGVHGSRWRATVNISVGSLGGPHDGSSITERALDQLVSDSAGRLTLVFASGNAARRRIHAHRTIGVGGPGRFDVLVAAGNPAESFVEFWLRDEDLEADGLDRVGAAITLPGSTKPIMLKPGGVAPITDDHGNPIAAAIFCRRVAQGDQGTMLLLAIRPTQHRPGSGDLPLAPHGAWSVVFDAASVVRPIDVHAWVERNETIIGRRGGQRTRFVPERPAGRADDDYVSPAYTMTSFAHGERSVVVGSCIGTRAGDAIVAPYSGRGGIFGRPGVIKPDALCLGEASQWRTGQRVPGFFRGTTRRLGGTSAAAPQHARVLVDSAPEDPDSGLI